MKKLVVLMLVLAVGSLASAGLTLSADKTVVDISKGETAIVGIDALDQLANVGVFILLNGVGSMDISGASNSVGDGIIIGRPDLSPADFGADDALFAELVVVVVPPVKMADGPVVQGIVLSSAVEGWAMLKIMDGDSGATMNELAVQFVPEPMSMILLGLGGLFLRRRK